MSVSRLNLGAWSAGMAALLATAACHPRSRVQSAQPPDPSAPERATALGTEPLRGAIFSPSWGPQLAPLLKGMGVVGYWQPPREVIATLEARLRPALEAGREKPETVFDMPADPFAREQDTWGVSVSLKEILENFADYRCQYLGIVVAGGHRRVFVNCFPKEEMTHFEQSWFDYTRIDDGGPSYWRIQYDVATCRFMDFDVNASG
jgi:hypothetical protein